MKREIKFRAWNFLEKQMYEIDMIIFELGGEFRLARTVLDELRTIEHTPTTCKLMQYTGLKDKKGKPIFEGDIVKVTIGHNHWGDGSDDVLEVCWRNYDTDNGWHLITPATDEYEEEISGNVSLSEFDIEQYGLKIVGNIYENPELLKV